MQWLGQAMNRVLRGKNARATIIGATSGDTGAAAIEAFAEQSQVEVFILYPQGRVSDVQRRQMTTANRSNVHALRSKAHSTTVSASSRSCSAILLSRRDASLGRQFHQLGADPGPDRLLFRRRRCAWRARRPTSFAVPTGNFGDVLAGYYAKRMGLPIERLIVATNENDILVRALATGRYAPNAVKATQSPSMDIQVSSNFERLLFEASDREPKQVVAQMNALAKEGSFAIPASALARIRGDFDAFRVDEPACAEEMGRIYRTSGMIIDPHSAVSVHAARKALAASPGDASRRSRNGPSGEVSRRRRGRDRRTSPCCRSPFPI